MALLQDRQAEILRQLYTQRGGLLGVFGEGTLGGFEAGTCQHEGLGLGAELSSTDTISRGQDMREHTLAESVAVAIESREVDRKVL